MHKSGNPGKNHANFILLVLFFLPNLSRYTCINKSLCHSVIPAKSKFTYNYGTWNTWQVCDHITDIDGLKHFPSTMIAYDELWLWHDSSMSVWSHLAGLTGIARPMLCETVGPYITFSTKFKQRHLIPSNTACDKMIFDQVIIWTQCVVECHKVSQMSMQWTKILLHFKFPATVTKEVLMCSYRKYHPKS